MYSECTQYSCTMGAGATEQSSDIQSGLLVYCMVALVVCCCAEANMYRQHLCRREAELLTWIHILINADSQTDTQIQYTHIHTHAHTLCMLEYSAHKLNQHTIYFSFRKTLSLSYFPQTFYLLGGWALRLGLILSCRLEPVPWGQLSANTQQPVSTYSDHGYTLCYTISTYKSTQQMHTASANHLHLDCLKETEEW